MIVIVCLIAIGILAALALIIARHGERLGIVWPPEVGRGEASPPGLQDSRSPGLTPQDTGLSDMGTLFMKLPVGSSVFLQFPGSVTRGLGPRDVRISIERASFGGVCLGIDAPPEVLITSSARAARRPAQPATTGA